MSRIQPFCVSTRPINPLPPNTAMFMLSLWLSSKNIHTSRHAI